MFRELMDSIWEEFARIIFHVEVNVEPAQADGLEPASQPAGVQYSGGGEAEQPSALRDARAQAAAGGDPAVAAAAPQETNGAAAPEGTHRDATTGAVVKDEHAKLGRNDPCWCGSGKKYKKCHGA
jgi:preprotein translocase subunit SecA